MLALLIAVILAPLLAGCGSGTSGSAGRSTAISGGGPSSKASPSSSNSGSATPAKPPNVSTIPEANLPSEARDVIHRIQSGGTFQYRQDGVTFANREGRLPAEPRGYYREYTVATPGAADRGARRLILGRNGELYYTSDHYRSFQWVLRGGAT